MSTSAAASPVSGLTLSAASVSGTDAEAISGGLVSAGLAGAGLGSDLFEVVVMLMSFPSRHCIRHGAPPDCTWLDEAELVVLPRRWPPRLSKSPKPAAGWRGQTKTSAPKGVAT